MSTRLNESPWKSDHDLFKNQTLPRLESLGPAIGAASSREGNLGTIALKIISLYSTIRRSYDPLTHCFLREALDEWQKLSNEQSEP